MSFGLHACCAVFTRSYEHQVPRLQAVWCITAESACMCFVFEFSCNFSSVQYCCNWIILQIKYKPQHQCSVSQLSSYVLFFRPDPRVGHTTDSIYLCLLPFSLTLPRKVLSTSWCCPSWSSSPACTWHCSLHYLFLQATPLFPHGVTIICKFPRFDSV